MKKIITILTLALALALPMHAQVFILEDETNEFRNETEVNGDWNNVIVHGSQDDQTNYMPLGNGIALLVAFGGAYLLNRKKKTNK